MISIHTNVANLSHLLEPSESRFCGCWIRLWSENKISIISVSLDWTGQSRGHFVIRAQCEICQSAIFVNQKWDQLMPCPSSPPLMMVNHGAKIYSHTNTINTVNTDAETHTICQLLIMAEKYFQQRYAWMFWLKSIRIKDETALKIGLDIDLKNRH